MDRPDKNDHKYEWLDLDNAYIDDLEEYCNYLEGAMVQIHEETQVPLKALKAIS